MRARGAQFVVSAAKPGQFPAPDVPEVAFAGRSNVGKSSLINALCDVKGLARTSQTPGRTRLVNWFRVEPPQGDPIGFVDLPGYGYAKVSRDMRDAWRPLVEAYLADRPTLRLVISLVDARRGPEQEEVDLMHWLEHAGVPARVVLTKIDKLPKNKRKPAGFAAQRQLGARQSPVLFSAVTGEGRDDLWRAILRAVRS